MAEADTAVLEQPGTSVPEVAATEPQLFDEQPTGALETGAEIEAGETEQVDEQPETLTRAEAEALAVERLAAREAEWQAQQREREVALERQRLEAEHNRRVEQANEVYRQRGVQSLTSLADWVARQVSEGKELGRDFHLDQRVLGSIAQPIQEAVYTTVWTQLANAGFGAIAEQAKGYKAGPELVTEYQNAAYSGDPAKLSAALLKLARDAYEQTELPKRKEEWLKAVKDEQTQAQKLSAARKAPADGSGAPTRLGAGAAPRGDHSAVLSSDKASPDEKRAAFKALHGIEAPF